MLKLHAFRMASSAWVRKCGFGPLSGAPRVTESLGSGASLLGVYVDQLKYQGSGCGGYARGKEPHG